MQALCSYLQINPAQFSQPHYARDIGFSERKTRSKFVLFKGAAEVNLAYFLIHEKALPENTLLSMIRPEISHDYSSSIKIPPNIYTAPFSQGPFVLI